MTLYRTIQNTSFSPSSHGHCRPGLQWKKSKAPFLCVPLRRRLNAPCETLSRRTHEIRLLSNVVLWSRTRTGLMTDPQILVPLFLVWPTAKATFQAAATATLYFRGHTWIAVHAPAAEGGRPESLNIDVPRAMGARAHSKLVLSLDSTTRRRREMAQASPVPAQRVMRPSSRPPLPHPFVPLVGGGAALDAVGLHEGV